VNEESVPQIRANTNLQRMQGDLTAQQWLNSAVQYDLIKEQVGEVQDRRANLRQENLIMEQQWHSAKRAAVADEERAKFFDTDLGKLLLRFGAGAREANPFLDSAHSAKSILKGK